MTSSFPKNKEGIPTHLSFSQAWEHRKLMKVVKRVKAYKVVKGRNRPFNLYPGDTVWAVLYISIDGRIPFYVARSDRLQMILKIPEDALESC
jgi:hypothetical protein